MPVHNIKDCHIGTFTFQIRRLRKEVLSMDSFSQVILRGNSVLAFESLIKSESLISECSTVRAHRIITANKLWEYFICINTSPPPPHPLPSPSFALTLCDLVCLLSAWLILHLDVTLAHRRTLLVCIIWFLGLQS